LEGIYAEHVFAAGQMLLAQLADRATKQDRAENYVVLSFGLASWWSSSHWSDGGAACYSPK
jgi:hypothetical protein